MFGSGSREHKDVIQVCYAVVVQCVVKNVVDVVLERGWGIAKAEWGHQHLVEPKASNECGKPLVAFSYTDSVERGDDVEFSVELSAAQGVQCFADERERISVLDGYVVQSSVVVADPYPSSWLSGEEEWSCGWGRRLADETFVEHLVNPLLNTSEFGRGKRAVLVVWGLLSWHNLDFMVPWTMWRELVSVFREECFDLVPMFPGKAP